MAVALIALVVAITTGVWASVDGGEAGLSDTFIGAIPTTILAIASIATSATALVRDVRPRWVAVTTFFTSAVLVLFFGVPLLMILL
ncbi:hypothetical protein [Leifsonia sp. TF02-11]|uniref:hypothetical protein n=1 Tax=Leifsonia sp. TF02-11 TaxID=2815212 RepID=UPI001AA154EE|nr:hypothetical protein [Leifsonia sp. TF02-11]MBO1738903.1 hypothetical protein [Leifsonia sp. TF02-11]